MTEARAFNGFGTNFEGSPEPIYGSVFLPRKFKVRGALWAIWCVDQQGAVPRLTAVVHVHNWRHPACDLRNPSFVLICACARRHVAWMV